jgi:hypothetical protein
MTSYHRAGRSRNTRNLPIPGTREPDLTKGGKIIKRCRPNWSASLCNAVATIAGIGQEVRHVG